MEGRHDDPEVLRRLLDEHPTLTMLVAGDGEIMWASAAVDRMFGRSATEVIGTNILEHLDPTWDPIAFDSIGAALEAEGLRLPMLFRVVLPDGGLSICEVWASSQLHDDVLQGLVVTVRRWDERVLLDRALETLGTDTPLTATLELLVQVLAAETLEADASIHLDGRRDGDVRVVATPGMVDAMDLLALDDANAPWERVRASGVCEATSVDDLDEPLRSAARARGYHVAWAWPTVDARTGRFDAVVVAWRRSDQLEPDHTRVLLMEYVCRIVRLAIDRERMLTRLQHAASHDALTGLANRSLFYGALETALGADGSTDDTRIGILYLDLDGFKPVNDRLGHGAGDQLLALVAERLTASVRDDDLVARLGGDEFAVLCAHAAGIDQLEALAARLLDAVSEPVVIAGERVSVGVSIGIAYAAAAPASGDALVETADAALREAKAAGKGAWRIGILHAG